MNYKEYQFSQRELLGIFVLGVGVTALMAWLFYQSFWAMVLFPFFYREIRKRAKQRKIEQREAQFLEEFMNGIRTLNTSLQAGLSMEKGFVEVERESDLLYGKESLFYKEIRELNQSVRLNLPIEKLFLEFAGRTQMEDIIQFAEVVDYGKRSGGNWRKSIDATVYRMNEKYEVRKEIEVMVAEKKLEQQVMNIMPLGILFFLQTSSGDYLGVMYHNPVGVVIMSFALAGYLLALYVSERILEIRV